MLAPLAFLVILILVFLLFRKAAFLLPVGMDAMFAVVWAMGLLIVLVIARALGKECCLDDPERGPFLLKIWLYAIAYSQSSAVLWAQLGGNSIYHRQKLLATLPLSQLELNLVHYLTGTVLLAGGLPVAQRLGVLAQFLGQDRIHPPSRRRALRLGHRRRSLMKIGDWGKGEKRGRIS